MRKPNEINGTKNQACAKAYLISLRLRRRRADLPSLLKESRQWKVLHIAFAHRWIDRIERTPRNEIQKFRFSRISGDEIETSNFRSFWGKSEGTCSERCNLRKAKDGEILNRGREWLIYLENSKPQSKVECGTVHGTCMRSSTQILPLQQIFQFFFLFSFLFSILNLLKFE